MKILVFNGSPKGEKSDTLCITRAFLAGMAETAKQEVKVITAVEQHVGQGDYSHLRYVMISGCGFPNSRQNFEPAVAQFRLLFPSGHTILTVPASPMFNVPPASVVTKPRLELVKEAGRQYAKTGRIDPDLLSAICSPMIPEAQYAAIVNGEA